MERIIIREKPNKKNEYFEKIKIGVVPMCNGSGASFISLSLAGFMANSEIAKVTYLEAMRENSLGKRYVYDALGMDLKFSKRKFYDFIKMIERGETIKGKLNLDEGINWILHIPSYENQISYFSKVIENSNKAFLNNLKLIYNSPGNVIICDFQIQENIKELLDEMDFVIAVVDSLPAALIGGNEMISICKKIENEGKKTIWVINKYNNGINKKEILKFLEIGEAVWVPAIPYEELCQAEYNCLSPSTNKKTREKIILSMNKIIETIFG